MIGKRIAEKRKANNLTQSVLAEAVGVTTPFISQIESGIRKPSYGLIIKICHQLNVPLDYILSGDTSIGENPADKLIFSAISHLDHEKKKKIIDYIYLLSGTKFYSDFPFFTSSVEYAKYILGLFKITDMPVDVFFIAEKLGVKIIHADIDEAEGVLYKNQENPLIILNISGKHHERNKFTVAILLGHLVLPWHLKQIYSRLKNKRSLDHEDQQEIEASEFAGELLFPGEIIKKDFKKIIPSIEIFEKFSAEKYKCSMTALAHKYTDLFGEKVAYLTANKSSITRRYDAKFPFNLVKHVFHGSIAHSFIDNPPATKETRCGLVKGDIWFEDISPNTYVYEESMLDPKFGITVTLIQLKKPAALP